MNRTVVCLEFIYTRKIDKKKPKKHQIVFIMNTRPDEIAASNTLAWRWQATQRYEAEMRMRLEYERAWEPLHTSVC